jgi:ribonuclease P protein component
LLDVFLAPSPVGFSRLGVIVPKHGRSIVERNRLKRRIREVGRRAVLPDAARLGLAVDVLVRARAEAYGAGYAAIEGGIREAVEGLWSDAS